MSFARSDLVAVVIAGAAALRMLLPFIALGLLLGAVPRPPRWPPTWPWSPTWIGATVAALGLGPLPALAAAARWLVRCAAWTTSSCRISSPHWSAGASSS